MERVQELLVAEGGLCPWRLPRRLPGPPGHERIPEHRPPHGEADESRDSGGHRQPLAHLCGVLAAAQDDAADVVATVPARGGNDRFAVLAPVESLALPHIGLALPLLQLLNALTPQPRPPPY